MGVWIVQFLNGITLGMLLFILAAGFTLIFGLMRFLNLAHGTLYLLGGYVGLSIARYTNSFFLAVIGGMLAIGILGMLIHRTLLRYTHGYLPQALLTIGIALFLGDFAIWVWGGYSYLIPKPKMFNYSVPIGELGFPAYRLLIMIVGTVVAVFLWWFYKKSRYGAIIRAGVDNERMAQAVGINIQRVMTLVFGLGAMLAGLGGVMGGPLGIYPGYDFELLTLALVVVVIGGMGSLGGTLVGALIVGITDNLAKILIPDLSLFFVFSLMAFILAIKPTGLFASRGE